MMVVGCHFGTNIVAGISAVVVEKFGGEKIYKKRKQRRRLLIIFTSQMKDNTNYVDRDRFRVECDEGNRERSSSIRECVIACTMV